MLGPLDPPIPPPLNTLNEYEFLLPSIGEVEVITSRKNGSITLWVEKPWKTKCMYRKGSKLRQLNNYILVIKANLSRSSFMSYKWMYYISQYCLKLIFLPPFDKNYRLLFPALLLLFDDVSGW